MNPPLPLLAPGHELTETFYLILRSQWLRARWEDGPQLAVQTPILTLQLAPAPAPRVSLIRSPSVHAVVTSVDTRKGRKLLYTDWYTCPGPSGPLAGGSTFGENPPSGGPSSYYGTIFNWIPVVGRIVRPGCPQPLEWHVAVGRLNHPVAYLDYVAPYSPAWSERVPWS